MNFHTDAWINTNVHEHYKESLQYFPADRTVGIFYQGSGNYALDYEDSDVDTKLILVPSFKDIAMNKNPISTTHVRENDEHTDWKDIRLYMQTFRKQNINFVEILFTKYFILNPLYKDQWNRLVEAREQIGRYNIKQALKAMQGVAKEKYFAMEHRYPSRIEWLDKYGYDPKQLHHLMRVEDFIERYIDGESYEKCLVPDHQKSILLLETKKGNAFTLEEARVLADKIDKHIDEMVKSYLDKNIDTIQNAVVEELLDDVQYNIMRIAVEAELNADII